MRSLVLSLAVLLFCQAAVAREVVHELLNDVSDSLNQRYELKPDSNPLPPGRRIDLANLTLSYVFGQWPAGQPVSVFDWADETIYVGQDPMVLRDIYTTRFGSRATEYPTFPSQAVRKVQGCSHVMLLSDGTFTDQEVRAISLIFSTIVQRGFVSVFILPSNRQDVRVKNLSFTFRGVDQNRYLVQPLGFDAAQNARLLLARVHLVSRLKVSCDNIS